MRHGLTRAIRPRESLIDSARYPIAFFRCHELTGAVINDAFGNVGPITLGGDTATSLSANAGYITPPDDGTGNKTASSDAYLVDLMDVGKYSHIIIGFDFYHTAAPSAAEGFFGWGSVAASNVGWHATFGTSENTSIAIRGPGASTQGVLNVPTSTLASYRNQRNSMLLELKLGSTWAANLYHQGTLMGSISDAVYGTGGVRPSAGGNTQNDVLLFSRVQAAGGGSALGDSGSGARIGRILITSREEIDVTLAQKIATEMYRYKGEIPRSAL